MPESRGEGERRRVTFQSLQCTAMDQALLGHWRHADRKKKNQVLVFLELTL